MEKKDHWLSEEALELLTKAIQEKRISIQSLEEDIRTLMNLTIMFPSNGQAGFKEALPHIPPAPKLLPERLTEDPKHAESPYPGLLTLLDFMKQAYVSDTQTTEAQMQGTIPQQIRHIVRRDTQDWLKQEILNLWQLMLPFRKKSFFYIPVDSGYRLDYPDPDSAMFDDYLFDKIPINDRFHEYCRTEDPDSLNAVLKQILSVSCIGFTEMWWRKNMHTKEYKDMQTIFAATEMQPADAITRGFSSALDFGMETLHFTVMSHAKSQGSPDDSLYAHITQLHKKLQMMVAGNLGLQSFARLEHGLTTSYTPLTLSIMKKNTTPDKWAYLKRDSQNREDSSLGGINPALCLTRYVHVQEKSVPVFDVDLSKFDKDFLEYFHFRQSQRGCPALPVIPEFLETVYHIYKATILPVIRKHYR